MSTETETPAEVEPPPEEPRELLPVIRNPDNDEGTAAQFIDYYGDALRFVVESGVWLLWDSSRWVKDNALGSAIRRKFIEFTRVLMNEAFQIENHKVRGDALKRYLSLGNSAKIESTLSLAKHDPRVQVSETDLDADPMLAGVENGIIDLRTGKLLPPDPSRYVTRSLRGKFNPDATCPMWEKFISEIFGGDAELIDFVWKAAGYSLTGLTREQLFTFLHGVGANGKSTLISMLMDIFYEYAGVAGKNLIARPLNGTYPEHEIAELCGVRFVVASETAEGERLNENVIKDITGGDRLRGRRIYQHGFSFVPQCKLWVYGNYKPDVRGTDDGIWRRVRLVPFLKQFSGAEKDPALGEKLKSEREGILAWLVRGCLAWQKEGMPTPAVVADAVRTYREDSDTLREFIEDNIIVSPASRVARTDLYSQYRTWAETEGLRPFSGRTFTARFRDRGIAHDVRSNGARYWEGIQLTP